MAKEERKTDAIQYPVGWTPNVAGEDPAEKRANYVRPLLGSPMVFRVGSPVFVSLAVSDTILYCGGHPLSGQPRYDWVEQPDGCSFGYLKPEAK